VGIYDDATGTHGFLYNGSTYTPLNVPGAMATQAWGISGTSIVGWYTDATGDHGFLATPVSVKTEIHTLLKDLVVSIGSFNCKTFKNCRMRKDLIRRLHDVTTDIERRNHGDALNDLYEVLRRVDGCALSGAPDHNDWIIDCQAQVGVHGQLMVVITEVKELNN
jgi:hypothetical protein